MLLPTNSRRYKPLQISYTTLGSRRENPRFWQEGLRLSAAGFTPGAQFRRVVVPEAGAMILEITRSGGQTHTVSSRARGEEDPLPIIDINNQELGEAFDQGQLLRVCYYKDKIITQIHSHDLNRHLAIQDFWANLRAGTLTMATVCVGGGITTAATKDGLQAVGIRAESEWVLDMESKYLQSLMDNTQVANNETMIVQGMLGQVEVDQLVPVNVLNLTLPCTGASTAGRNRLKNPESHKTAGTTVLKAMEIVEKLMPPVIINENVVAWASTASADLMAGRLLELGYHIDVRECGGEFGTLEDRRRSIMVATHPSLALDMATLVPVMKKEGRLADVLEDIPLDDPMWKPYSYLAEKEARDIANGKGYRRQLLTGEEEGCGVLGRGYNKARSTEPFIQHPTNPELSRLLTEKEHAAVMKIPPELVRNVSKTVAHEILGQSGSYALFHALGQWLGTAAQAKLGMRDSFGPGLIEAQRFDQMATAKAAINAFPANDGGATAQDSMDEPVEEQLDMWGASFG